MCCRECRALLWSYVDRELSDSQQDAVVQHLADCNACALAHERLRAFPLHPNQMTAVAPPPDFTARLMRRIKVLPPPRQLATMPGATARRDGLGGMAGALVALSAAAAALLLGLLSTCAVALLSGASFPLSAAPSLPLRGIVAAVGDWFTAEARVLLSWPVLLALCGMQLVLAILWLRVVVPRRR